MKLLPTLRLAAAFCLLALAAGCATTTRPAAAQSDATPTTDPSGTPTAGSGSGVSGTGSDAAAQSSDVFHPAPLTGTIGTGRPSFGTGTTPVPVGHFQLESGYQYTEDGDSKTHTFPQFLARYGVYDGIELRVGWTGLIIPEGGDNGTTDLRFGAKLAVRKQDGFVPAMAFQPSFTVPTGDASASDQIDPQVQFPLAWSVGENVTVLANLLLGTSSVGHDTRPVYAQSLLVGYALTDRLNVFGEYFGVNTQDRAETHNVDAGVLFLLNDNAQLDFVIGGGLNEQADDFFVGAGYSFRI